MLQEIPLYRHILANVISLSSLVTEHSLHNLVTMSVSTVLLPYKFGWQRWCSAGTGQHLQDRWSEITWHIRMNYSSVKDFGYVSGLSFEPSWTIHIVTSRFYKMLTIYSAKFQKFLYQTALEICFLHIMCSVHCTVFDVI